MGLLLKLENNLPAAPLVKICGIIYKAVSRVRGILYGQTFNSSFH